MLFRHCVAVRVAWTSATGTASRDPTPPLGWPRGSRGQRAWGTGTASVAGGEGSRETGLENVRDDNYALQVIARLQLNGAGGLPACPAAATMKRELSSENHGF